MKIFDVILFFICTCFIEIEYIMPLRKDCKRQSDVTDSGYDTADSATSLSYTENQNLDDEEDETQDEWLQSLGVENSEIRKINNSQVILQHVQFFFISILILIF